LLSGMISTRQQLLDALAEEGLTVIPTEGEKFDPEVHEPVGAAAGNGDLYVGQELRRGYQLNGRLIRAALVSLESANS
jgi:molecular chaperone GrpE